MKEPGELFAEDFDRPDTPGPQIAEPVFSAADLAAAGEAGWREGREAGLQEAAMSDAAATRQAMTTFATSFEAVCDAAATRAEASADAIARLLMHGLAAMFPTLCARYGDAEVRDIVRALLPALSEEMAIAVRANPRTAAAIAEEIALLEPELAEHVQLIECDAMASGDVRIAWRNGTATRDASSLWQQVAAVLAPAGLLHADVPIKETVDGD
jgi:flagellar biosynthesis/type III secretory pathway protein FliH